VERGFLPALLLSKNGFSLRSTDLQLVMWSAGRRPSAPTRADYCPPSTGGLLSALFGWSDYL